MNQIKLKSDGRLPLVMGDNFLYYLLKYCEVLFNKIEEKNNSHVINMRALWKEVGNKFIVSHYQDGWRFS